MTSMRVGLAFARDLIGAVGREDYGPRLLRLVRLPLEADLISALVFETRGPLLIGHGTRAAPAAEQRAVRGYLSGCYRQDPNTNVLLDELRPGETVTVYMNRADVPTLSYRRLCYEEPRIVDRLSVLHRTEQGRGISVNFYRSEPNGPFQARELSIVAELAPLLSAASARHYELISSHLAPADFDRTVHRVSERFPPLTKREAECSAGVIAGLTATQIALKLGIRQTSVITHRKRAYQRLGVSGQRELVALFYAAA